MKFDVQIQIDEAPNCQYCGEPLDGLTQFDMHLACHAQLVREWDEILPELDWFEDLDVLEGLAFEAGD